MFHRHQLLQGIFDNLSPEHHAKVFTNQHVTAIENLEGAVRVSTADGSIFEGNMVIGADGVHSTVRTLMPFPAGSVSIRDAANPFSATYRVLFGNAPKNPLVSTGVVYNSHGANVSVQFFVGNERMWFFVYEKLAEPTTQKRSYSSADADAFAQEHGNIYVAPGLVFHDVYATRHGAGLTNLEEGVLPAWSAGRIALVGDAAHKVTPNMGWGYNSGVMDLVALINPLRRALIANGGTQLSNEAIADVFATYEAERMAFMTKIHNLSASVTRTSTWATTLQRVLDQYVFPLVKADELVAKHVLGPMVSSAPVLYWLDEEHFCQGSIPWQRRPDVEAEAVPPEKTAEIPRKAFLPVALTAGAIFASWSFAHHGVPDWLAL